MASDRTAHGPAVALLGPDLVAEAGGLPEAAAALGAALKTNQLVACVADGAIGAMENKDNNSNSNNNVIG